MEAKVLREITNQANVNKANKFWESYSEKTLFPFLKTMAEGGNEAIKITENNSDLNPYGWLTYPRLYNKVIFELIELGYAIKHSDDKKDGVYIFIKWGGETEDEGA